MVEQHVNTISNISWPVYLRFRTPFWPHFCALDEFGLNSRKRGEIGAPLFFLWRQIYWEFISNHYNILILLTKVYLTTLCYSIWAKTNLKEIKKIKIVDVDEWIECLGQLSSCDLCVKVTRWNTCCVDTCGAWRELFVTLFVNGHCNCWWLVHIVFSSSKGRHCFSNRPH